MYNEGEKTENIYSKDEDEAGSDMRNKNTHFLLCKHHSCKHLEVQIWPTLFWKKFVMMSLFAKYAYQKILLIVLNAYLLTQDTPTCHEFVKLIHLSLALKTI